METLYIKSHKHKEFVFCKLTSDLVVSTHDRSRWQNHIFVLNVMSVWAEGGKNKNCLTSELKGFSSCACFVSLLPRFNFVLWTLRERRYTKLLPQKDKLQTRFWDFHVVSFGLGRDHYLDAIGHYGSEGFKSPFTFKHLNEFQWTGTKTFL